MCDQRQVCRQGNGGDPEVGLGERRTDTFEVCFKFAEGASRTIVEGKNWDDVGQFPNALE